MNIVQPYCETNYERLEKIIASGGEEENLYRFDKYLEYFKNQDYSQKPITRPDFTDYFVTVPENEEPEHAVQKYLEEHTGIRRD